MNNSPLVKRLIDLLLGRSRTKRSAPEEPLTKPLTITKPEPEAQTSKTKLSQNIEQEIRAQRKFTLAEAIGREGGSFMKGESAIPRPLRAIAQINQFIAASLPNSTSALSTALQSWAKEDIRVSRHLDTPLVALSEIIESLIDEPTTFQEFFRQVAIAHSHLTGDRPHFQAPNQSPHPNSQYSHKSVKHQLAALLKKIEEAKTP